MQHCGLMQLAVAPHVAQAESARHRHVDLDRREGPGAAEHVPEIGLDLRRVEGGLAGLDPAMEARAFDGGDQRLLGDVPIRQLAEELLGARRDRHLDPVDAELLVDLGGHLEEAVDLVRDLLGLAVDVGIVLGEGADAGDAVERAAALVAMQARELRPADRELAVAALRRAVEMAMARTVHRLDAELLALVRAGEPVHVVVELLVVARGLEQIRAEELRRHDLAIAVLRIEIAHEADELVVERHALRQVERRAGRERIEVEEAELGADAAVIAALRLLDALEVLRELLLRGEGGAVDALELRPRFVAAEIGARGFEQLHGADLGGVLDVGPAAEIHEPAVAEDRDLGAVRDVGEARELELFAHRREQPLGLGAGDDLALEVGLLGEDRVHLLLDLREILGREGVLHEEVVLELVAVVAAAGVDLGLREQTLHGVGHHVFGRMPDHLAAGGILRGHDLERDVPLEGPPQIDQRAVDPAREGRLREAGTDLARHVEHGGPDRELETSAVGQSDGERRHDRGRAALRASGVPGERTRPGACRAARAECSATTILRSCRRSPRAAIPSGPIDPLSTPRLRAAPCPVPKRRAGLARDVSSAVLEGRSTPTPARFPAMGLGISPAGRHGRN